MTQLLLDIAPDWSPTLENFVAGRNEELIATLPQMLVGDIAERSIYLWGEANSGKTHLLLAILGAAHELGLSTAQASKNVPGMAQVVAVDNVEGLDAEAQVELFTLYNRMRDSGGLLIVSGNAAPAHLQLRDDLRTRLGWGLVYELQPLSDEEKAAALAAHAAARGFELPAEVTQYLLRHGRRDWPYLLATLDALDTQCLRLQRGASVPLLKEVMARGRA
jgi:DnaA family protein